MNEGTEVIYKMLETINQLDWKILISAVLIFVTQVISILMIHANSKQVGNVKEGISGTLIALKDTNKGIKENLEKIKDILHQMKENAIKHDGEVKEVYLNLRSEIRNEKEK